MIAVRKCTGVRPAAGEPAIACSAKLTAGQTRQCPRCDAEVERRQAADISRRAGDGRATIGRPQHLHEEHPRRRVAAPWWAAA